MIKILAAIVVVAAVSGAAVAQTPPPAPPPAATGYSVATTKIGVLLDTPALMTIFEEILPDLADDPQIEQGRDMTLPDIVKYVPDILTPEKLAQMDAALKTVPPR
jgi:para-nitrobenzyl esterase